MGDKLITLEELQEATRVRLTAKAMERLRDWQATLEGCGDKGDRMDAHALGVLLDMHDKLEALRHGEG